MTDKTTVRYGDDGQYAVDVLTADAETFAAEHDGYVYNGDDIVTESVEVETDPHTRVLTEEELRQFTPPPEVKYGL